MAQAKARYHQTARSALSGGFFNDRVARDPIVSQ